MKKIISLLLFLITVTAFFCVSSFGVTYDTYEDNSDAWYYINYLADDTCGIVKIRFKNDNIDVTIPSQIAGRTVTELGDGTNAVLWSSLTPQKLILPNTIQKINDNASKDASEDLCETLIITGNNIQYIGEKALYGTYNGLRKIVFPDLKVEAAQKLEFAKDFAKKNGYTTLYFPNDYAYNIYYDNLSLYNNFNDSYIKPRSSYNGSTISDGNTWIIIAGAVVILGGIVAIVISKKKKKIAE